MNQYADGHTRLQDLVMEQSLWLRRELTDHVTKETSNSTQSILKKLEEFGSRMPRTAEEEEARHKRFLGSLRYSSMNDRRSLVRESHTGTFGWMLGAPANVTSTTWEAISRESQEADVFGTKKNQTAHWLDEDPWFSRDDVLVTQKRDDFGAWLKSASNLYWISGKPGSGKSTLVKFLVHSPLTQEALNTRNPATRIISHFFWKPGDEMQNSTRGLFCSLLHHLGSSDPVLITSLLESFPALKTKDSYHDWSVKELSEVCLVALKSHPSAVCVFIDGLDEAREADIPNVLEAVERIRAVPKVKVCVSSRPEPRFLQRYRFHKNLKLEDLTLGDMRKFAAHSLKPFLESSPLSSETNRSIPDELARKAQGVFLWLYLATKSLVRGLDNGDRQKELAERLAVLPTELEDLYKDMWKRLNDDGPIYRESTALFLNLILDARTITRIDRGPDSVYDEGSLVVRGKVDLFHFMGATQPALQKLLLEEQQTVPESHVLELCRETERAIHVRSAGLLEILPTESSPSPYRSTHSDDTHFLVYYTNCTAHFIHRTAHDFLVDTAEGRGILAYDTSSAADRLTRLLRGYLVKTRFVVAAPDYNAVLDALLLIRGVDCPRVREQLFETCWRWYDSTGPWMFGDFGAVEQAHFLGIAVGFPPLHDCIRPAVLRDPKPFRLATRLLLDLLRGQMLFDARTSWDEIPSRLESLEFVLSLGANPRRKVPPRPPPRWALYVERRVLHSVPFMTPLCHFLLHVQESLPAKTYNILMSASAQGRRDPNERCPLVVSVDRDGSAHVRESMAGFAFHWKTTTPPPLCQLVLDSNTEFAIEWAEAVITRLRGRRSVERARKRAQPWLAWPSFMNRHLAGPRGGAPLIKPSASAAVILIQSPDDPDNNEPPAYAIHNKQMSDKLVASLKPILFGSKKSPADGGSKRAHLVQQIIREIRSSSKDYPPLNGPVTDYLAEIGCGFCFVDEEYKRVVKRKDGSWVRVDTEDWDEESPGAVMDGGEDQSGGEAVPSLWFVGAWRVFAFLLWISAWLWPLRLTNVERMRLGKQKAS